MSAKQSNLSFNEFVAQRKQVADIGLEIGVSEMEGQQGYVYPGGCYIEVSEDEFFLVIGNQDWLEKDLGQLERLLYGNWYVSQIAD
jgi:hypothetical protein